MRKLKSFFRFVKNHTKNVKDSSYDPKNSIFTYNTKSIIFIEETIKGKYFDSTSIKQVQML